MRPYLLHRPLWLLTTQKFNTDRRRLHYTTMCQRGTRWMPQYCILDDTTCWFTNRPKCEHTLEQSYSGMYSILQHYVAGSEKSSERDLRTLSYKNAFGLSPQRNKIGGLEKCQLLARSKCSKKIPQPLLYRSQCNPATINAIPQEAARKTRIPRNGGPFKMQLCYKLLQLGIVLVWLHSGRPGDCAICSSGLYRHD